MREVYEFNVNEAFAGRLFRPDEGERIGISKTTRRVYVRGDDPRLAKIGELDKELKRKTGRGFFLYWDVEYRYSAREISNAEVFHFCIGAVVEPAGEQCGTVYDDSTACQHVFAAEKDVSHIYPGLTIGPDLCGAGRIQVSELVLDLRKVPKTRAIAATIADEWIISQQLAELLLDAKVTGFELRPVLHKARYEDDAMDPQAVPAGRELLRRAAEAGCPHPTWPFWCWLNRREQNELCEQMTKEWVAMRRGRERPPRKLLPVWHQLVVTSRPVRMAPPTRCGGRPFEAEADNKYRCPHGHLAGLSLLSEVFVKRCDWDGSDIFCTKELVGVRRGLLMPAPLLLISPRVRKLLLDNKIKGWSADVAYLR